MEKHRILLVDDSPSELRILMQVLRDKYAIVAATSGFQAVKMIEDDPDIEMVLLDVVMPDMSGYETCQKIHEIAPNMPVIFVSGNTQTEEILQGFDSGGVDYLTKPIDTTVVARKVKVIIDERNKLLQAQSEHQTSDEMVMNVITSAGHLGTVLGFLRSGLKLRSPEALVSSLFDVFEGLNIDAIVQLRHGKRRINRANSMSITPLEKDLLDRAALMKTRFLEKGSRYIVNFDSVSVIIKNMPEDEITRGDLRDNLMMILEDTDGLNQKILYEAQENQNRSQSDMAVSVKSELKDVQATMNMVADMQVEHKKTTMHILEDMTTELESSFSQLGLIETQEKQIAGIVQQRTQEIIGHIEEAMHIEDNLASLSERIGKISGS